MARRRTAQYAMLWAVGLDVYVGSLTRYYARDWELASQRAGRELGMAAEVVRPDDPPDAIRDPEQIRAAVLAWRDGLNEALREHLGAPLAWDEGSAAPYFTDKPTWQCYSDLVLWAAYDEQPQLRRPAEHVEDWNGDEAYALTAAAKRKRYGHLYDVAMWLPGDGAFTFKAEDIAGTEMWIGWSGGLLQNLRELNQRTWRATPDQLHEWLRQGADSGCPLETGARFAFAVFVTLAGQAVLHRLPMRLDW